MSTNYSLLFYLKKPKSFSGGPQPIYMRLTVEGRRSEISTGKKCDPARWNPHANRAKGTKEMIRQLNQHLDTTERKVYDAYLQLLKDDTEITADALKLKYQGKDNKNSKRGLVEVFLEHNRKIEALVGNGYAQNTLKSFQQSVKHLTGYLSHTHHVSDFDVARIDLHFVQSYEHFLRAEKGCRPITAAKYMKHLRKIVNLCIAHRWIKENPFAFYKSTVKPTVKTFLSAEELKKIETKEFSIPRLAHVRDIFVFCCYTGLSYADVRKLKRADITIGVDGRPWIITSRQKTTTVSNIPLLSQALDIVKRYEDYPPCAQAGLALPVMSNQKMNSYLKEIADVSGVAKTLTFHMARHTFATTVTLANNVPIETVAKMMGHINIKTTQHYAKLLDTRVSRDMLELQQQLSAKQSNG